jgi:hypothetical protein
MHFQHDNRYSLVLANFIFLPHILQWHQDKVDRFCFFVVLKSIFVFAAAAIPSQQVLQTTYQIQDIFTVL